MPDTELLKRINAGREVFYNFLSRSYQKEVDDEYLEMLISLIPHIEDMTSQTEVVALNSGGKLLREFVDQLEGLNAKTKKELLLDLARDFAYIFLTGVKSIPTCESVYRSPEHLLKQGPFYLDVRRIYDANNFQVLVDFNEPEDHIAIQFKFLAVLSKRMSGAIEAGDFEKVSNIFNNQRMFIGEHTNKWIHQFCQLMLKASGERLFYKAISYLTEGFLSLDYEVIQKEMSQLIDQTRPEDSI